MRFRRLRRRGRSWLVLFLIIAGCSDPERNPRRLNVLIVTMDTTRPDHLHCYGHDGIRTPVLDGLAADGVLFEQALSVQPVTLPAHTSVMTGLYPYQHGVRDNSTYRLPEQFTTLAEQFRDAGYHTAAFVSAFVLHRRFGLNRGFELYNDTFIKPKQKGRLPVDRRASEVSFLAGEWLRLNHDVLAETPFFMWLHYYDPHADYNPPEPYRSAYEDRYDGEIAYTDDWIGYVIDSLKIEGFYDNTLIIVVGDHGESLGEYGENTHGMFIYQPTIRIPLIMHCPAVLPRGIRIPDPVCSVDLYPTLMDILGWNALPPVKPPPPGDVETAVDRGPVTRPGISLLDAIHGRSDLPVRELYRETYIPENFNWSHLAGIQAPEWLYIQAPRPELLPLTADGTAGDDVIATEFERGGLFQAKLNRMLGPDEGRRSLMQVDADTAAKLESLGYFVQPDPGKPAGDAIPRADPKDRVALFNRYQRALTMQEIVSPEYAAAILEDLTVEDPENMRFAKDLAQMYIDAGDLDSARRELDRIVLMNPGDLEAHLDLGNCLEMLGDSSGAIREYRAALTINESNYLARFHLGMIHLKAGEFERAENEFMLCRAVNPRDPACLNNLGYIAMKYHGDTAAGLDYLEKALKLEPENIDILVSAGNAYRNAGQLTRAMELLETALMLVPDRTDVIDELVTVYELTGRTGDAARLKQRRALL
ncbi:MAG TPA: sulfatase-like hydrolase/transferase [bacterium]|nr:sulfatase-like hydrolase/transferase [bacterium]